MGEVPHKYCILASSLFMWSTADINTSLYVQPSCENKDIIILGFKCQWQVGWLCSEKELFIYAYIWVYLRIYEEVSHKPRSVNLALTFETHILVSRLTLFGKELFKLLFSKTGHYIFRLKILVPSGYAGYVLIWLPTP